MEDCHYQSIPDGNNVTTSSCHIAATSLVVSTVATGADAWQKGVRAGDLLIAVNGVPALEHGKNKLESRDMRQDGVATWVFMAASTSASLEARMEVCTSALSVGITLELTTEAAVETIFRSASADAGPCRNNLWGLAQRRWEPSASLELYWLLWEGGCWDLLKRHTPAWNYRPSCVVRIFAFASKHDGAPRDPDPWTLLSAAADYELGNQSAIEGIADFWQIEEKWTMNYHALVRYYFARDLIRPDPHPVTLHILPGLVEDETQALDTTVKELLVEAIGSADESARIKALVEQHVPASQLQKPPFRPFEFPSYALPVLASKHQPATASSSGVDAVSLDEVVQRSPFLLVVLLGGYRANGPYMKLMSQWLRWAEAFGQLGLNECHVVTAAEPAAAEHPKIQHLLNSERRALAAAAPGLTSVLHDAEESLAQALQVHIEIECSPFCLLLQGRTVVMHSQQQEFDDVTLYEALTSTSVGS